MTVEEYVRRSILLGPKRLEKYVFRDDKPNPERRIIGEILDELEKFSETKENRILLLYGLRGVGKTTLMAQTYFKLLGKVSQERLLYISADEVALLNSDMLEAVKTYEALIGERFEELSRPVFLFIDEVHYDKNWDLILKSLYDKARNLFVLATGSSALAIKMSTDLARRARRLHVTPLTFSEYLAIKRNVKNGISSELRNALFSSDSMEACKKLEALRNEVGKILLQFDKMDLDDYIVQGTLPVFLSSKEPLYDTYTLIERMIYKDLALYGFSSEILEKAFSLLVLLASGESLNYETLCSNLNISRPTLAQLLSGLEKLEIVFPVRAYGSIGKNVRKTPKYKFLAPMLRASILTKFNLFTLDEKILGMLLEDAVALYFYILSSELNFRVNYDAQKGGADFVLTFPDKKIVIEVGYGNKGIKQVKRTMRKVDANFGIVIWEGNLEVEGDIIKVPKEWFMLII
nr:ATP-binding protein [Thermococcus sp. MV5]